MLSSAHKQGAVMSDDHHKWTFLSNHAHVLVLLARDPHLRMRDLSDEIGITERAVQRIVSELTRAGYLEVHKEGRRNHYQIHREKGLRHSIEARATVDTLLHLVE